MKIYKIGRHYYQEIDENTWCEFGDFSNDKLELFTLSDNDGEPIKFFKRCRKPKLVAPKGDSNGNK